MYNYVKIYDLNRTNSTNSTPERVFDSTQFKGNVTSVGFRSHDKILYTSCEDGYLKVFDLRAKNPTK
jgi:WD40 repeat protein